VPSIIMSRRTKFLATGAMVFAVGLDGGGLAYAASSGSALSLTPVRGVPARVIEAKPVPLNCRCPSLTPFQSSAPGSRRPGPPLPAYRALGRQPRGRNRNDGTSMLLRRDRQPQRWPMDVVAAASMSHGCGCPPSRSSIDVPSMR
jgi:hypothetical protein